MCALSVAVCLAFALQLSRPSVSCSPIGAFIYQIRFFCFIAVTKGEGGCAVAMQFQGVESPLVCWGCLARFGMPGYLVGWEALEEWPMDRLDMAVLGSGRGERCVAPIANGWFRERWLRDLLGWALGYKFRVEVEQDVGVGIGTKVPRYMLYIHTIVTRNRGTDCCRDDYVTTPPPPSRGPSSDVVARKVRDVGSRRQPCSKSSSVAPLMAWVGPLQSYLAHRRPVTAPLPLSAPCPLPPPQARQHLVI
jgi:hypothetical protein